jgi:hypothetical protein
MGTAAFVSMTNMGGGGIFVPLRVGINPTLDRISRDTVTWKVESFAAINGKDQGLKINKKVAGAEGGACHFFYYSLLAAAEELAEAPSFILRAVSCLPTIR